jgi:hypothetical protein
MRATSAAVLAAITMLVGASGASADTTTVGEFALTPSNGEVIDSTQNVPVFQGDASGNYTLSSPRSGTITSWSFLSAGAATGEQYALRVLAPVGTGGTEWEGTGTSATVSVTSQQGVDAVNGPFTTDLPIAAGDRIALQPIGDGNVPTESGVNGEDGIRYFSAALADGSSATIAPGSGMDNGQVIPIQATVEYAPTLSELASPVIVAGSSPNGSPATQVRDGEVLTCRPGTYNLSPLAHKYSWFFSETTYVRKGSHGIVVPITTQTALTVSGQTITLPDLPAFATTSVRNEPASTVSCVDSASYSGGATVNAQSTPVHVHPLVPVLSTRLVPGPRNKPVRVITIKPPSITKGVGAGGTNTCEPGTWAHFPTRYTYSWWTAPPKDKTAKSFHKLVHKGQTYKPTTDDEGLRLACFAVAYNDAGAALHQISNTYVVPASSPKSTSAPTVTMSTDDPHRDQVNVTSATHATLPGYGANEWAYYTTIAEKVYLGCDTGDWNRNDLTFTTHWYVDGQAIDITGDTRGNDFVSIGDPYAFTETVAGDSLRFNFTPDNTQTPTLFNGSVTCTVTATTPQGRSSVATSDTLRIWNGCDVGIETWDDKILRTGPLCADYAPYYSNFR